MRPAYKSCLCGTNESLHVFFRLPALSFYPRHDGASIFDHIETDQLPDPITDEPHTENEEDWIDAQAEEMTVLPQGLQEKAMAIEVRWQSLATMFDTV